MKQLALIGCGAIATAVMELLRDDEHVRVTQLIVRADNVMKARSLCDRLAPQAQVLEAVDHGSAQLVAECAGHEAVAEHVLPALEAGLPVVLASIGALHDVEIERQLSAAARRGHTQLQLVAGAIGGIDALAAARIGGLRQVHYIGRKPPLGWRGTPAEKQHDLATMTVATAVFEGSARDAARLFPKNANVAATVSLAGLGFDATRATLIADPGVQRNVHRIVGEGVFGRLDLTLESEPLPANPKTSALTVYSIVRALHNATRVITI